MNTSEESGEWTNPDGQNDRSMDDEEEEDTEEGESTLQEKNCKFLNVCQRSPKKEKAYQCL